MLSQSGHQMAVCPRSHQIGNTFGETIAHFSRYGAQWSGREVDVDRVPAITRAMIMHERINFIANEMPFSLKGGS
jgi:hypothetical protein